MELGTLLQLLVIIIILVGGAMLSKSYFQKAKMTVEDKERWKKNAINHNTKLNEAFASKDDKTYSDLVHPKATRYMPKLPYRVDGAGDFMKKIRNEMEQVGGGISIIQSSAELYSEALVVTYHYVMDGKIGEKFLEGSGKVSRVWIRDNDGWKLIHEHKSENDVK